MGEKVAPVKGHAFRAKPAQIGRRTVPGCECGERLGMDFPTTEANARRIHADHKKAVLREAVS